MNIYFSHLVKRAIFALLVVFSSTLIVNLATAEEAKKLAIQPNTYSITGIVRSVNKANRSMNIDGRIYYYSRFTTVKDTKFKASSLSKIRKGTEIGFNFSPNDQQYNFLEGIWILPKGVHQLM